MLSVLLLPAASAEEPVCAVVKIEIQQELTLERQGFDARMQINNGLDTLSIENLNVNVTFEDEDGNAVIATSDTTSDTASFFIDVSSMEGVTDINGGGSIAPQSSAVIHWLIIPAPGAAQDVPSGKLYFVGASLNYTVGGEPESTVVTPDSIIVKPLPLLTLDYFLERNVYADDAFTAEVEPPEPFTLGLRIRNNGSAAATNVAIDSAQPEITENDQGLLIGFTILGSYLNDLPRTNSLKINFGDIPVDEASVGRWDMVTTLSGRFTDFTASVTHADELGGELTSIIDAANTYSLIHDVIVDLPGRDNVRDFLAYPNGATGDVLTAYESDNVDSPVSTVSASSSFPHVSGSTHPLHTLNTPITPGLIYVKLPDPYGGEKAIKQVVRSDGKYIPEANAWLSKTRDLNTNPPSWDYWINFFDSNTTGTYSVSMGPPAVGPLPPQFAPVGNVTTYETASISFGVSATDPNGDAMTLSAAGLPPGAGFVDNGDGSGTFAWVPAVGQAGSYTVSFTATDAGGLSTSQSMTIFVNPENDIDGDGLDDDWEREHFGDLSRDGKGDFDGDGISDAQEFLDGTDPTIGTGPDAPMIQAPLYGDEVTIVQPTLAWQNSVAPPTAGVTYEVEVYADEAMTTLVSAAAGIVEIQDSTAWTVDVALDDNTPYFWRVRGFDGDLYSLWSNGRFFVNTANDAPGSFNINSPRDGAEVNTFNPTLEVTNSVDADNDTLGYDFEVYADQALTTPVASITDIAPGTGGVTNWYVDTALAENTLYYWRAIAVDEHGAQTVSNVASFFVNTANDAPGLPVAAAPADGAQVAVNSVDLIVDNAVDPDGDVLSYTFELDTVSSFDSVDLQSYADVPETATQTAWTVFNLAEDATYFWRVRASDGLAESGWTQARFTVNAVNSAPSVPTLANPGDQAWVASLTPTLSVNPVSDAEDDAVSYRFEIYADETLTTLVDEYAASEVQWMLSRALTNNLRYYWRARAEDAAGGVSDWSATGSFFVDDNGINDTPAFTFLEPVADVTVSDGALSLRWDDTDPDSSANIALYYDTDNSGADGTLIVGNLEEDADAGADSYTWGVTSMARGTYYIYAVIDDGYTSSTVYAPAGVTITQTQIILDNQDGGVTTTGEWIESTAVSGFHGADYQHHYANGPSPDAKVVDNRDAGFSTLGNWIGSTVVTDYYASDYQYHAANGDPVGGAIIDNRDAGFSTLGEWTASVDVDGYHGADYQHHRANGDPVGGLIIDNLDANVQVTGAWSHSASTGGYYGSDYQHHFASDGSSSFSWLADITDSGDYYVYARWSAHGNRASNATYTVNDNTGATTVTVDQRSNGGQWNLLGTFNFSAGGEYAISLSDLANGYVIADAVKIVPVDAPPNTATWTYTAPETNSYYVYARWSAHANRASNATYRVLDDSGVITPVSVDQRSNGGQWNLLGSFNFTAGASYDIALTDQADGYVIADAVKIVPTDAPPNTASWSFDVDTAGQHLVYARWTAHPNRATNAVYTVNHDSGSTPVQVDQQADTGQWVMLGTFDFTPGGAYSVDLTDRADGYVIADAISVVPVGAAPNSFSWNVTIPDSGAYEVYARWTSHANRATEAKYTVTHDGGEATVVVNQQQDGAQWVRLGTYNFTQGQDYSVTLTDAADGYVIADAIRLMPVP